MTYDALKKAREIAAANGTLVSEYVKQMSGIKKKAVITIEVPVMSNVSMSEVKRLVETIFPFAKLKSVVIKEDCDK
jgi:hypothetical protein